MQSEDFQNMELHRLRQRRFYSWHMKQLLHKRWGESISFYLRVGVPWSCIQHKRVLLSEFGRNSCIFKTEPWPAHVLPPPPLLHLKKYRPHINEPVAFCCALYSRITQKPLRIYVQGSVSCYVYLCRILMPCSVPPMSNCYWHAQGGGWPVKKEESLSNGTLI